MSAESKASRLGSSSGSPTPFSGSQTVGSSGCFSTLRSSGACIVKCWAKFAALFLSVAAIQSNAQSAPKSQGGAQGTQIRDSWIDPSTGLMWTGKDNGKDVNWKKAMKYCRDLRLGGYSDWKLPSMAELQGIYDPKANALGRDGRGVSTWHVKGMLFLTGNQWSSGQPVDDRGYPSGYAFRFDFNEGQAFKDEISFHTFKRALCVRDSGK
jgi:Protein of unknown function (DUF1566)